MSQLEQNEDPIQMSLSEIFDYADKNLRHARWTTGIAKYNLCCAIGAVSFVLSNGKTTEPYKLKRIDPRLRERYVYLRKEFIKRNRYHLSLPFYNDILLYSFKHLADKCRSMGL